MTDVQSGPSFDPHTITRLDPVLMTYYVLISILTLFGFPITVLVLFCKYHTLRYRFDDKGIAMSWGVLFRREIYLTYRRIQDIHVTQFENVQNVEVRQGPVQRYFGIADVIVETAGGGGGDPTQKGLQDNHRGLIEGISDASRIREVIIGRLRESRTAGLGDDMTERPAAHGSWSPQHIGVLREIRDEIAAMSL